jgi:putative endonuclease
MIECSDKSIYTGITNNVERRFSEHQNGFIIGSYTHSRRPLKLLYAAEFNDVRQAISFEKQIKRWSKKKKLALINQNWEELHNLAKRRTPDQKL